MKRAHDSKFRDLRLRRIRRITAGLVHHRAPAWSACGRLIASRLGEGRESYWVIVDRKGRIARVLEGPVDGGASFAPDGGLAFGRQVGATSEIWHLPSLGAGASGGATPRRLLGGDGRLYRDPAYSPDGRYLCYAADDGQAGAALRLWLLDLVHDEHRILVPELSSAIAADLGAGPVHISHPAWSLGGDLLYFEAAVGGNSAVYTVSTGTMQIERLTGVGYRRPAPLAPGLVLCERAGTGPLHSGETELVLIDHGSRKQRHKQRPGSGTGQLDEAVPPTSQTTLVAHGAREPAVVRRKKAAFVAWAMPCRAAPDEPNRFDLHVARLFGLPESSPTTASGRSSSETSSGETSTPIDAAASTEPEDRVPSAASVWLDRPLVLDEEHGAP